MRSITSVSSDVANSALSHLETFDGVINHNDSSIARFANAELATFEIAEVIERIHECVVLNKMVMLV